MQKNDVNSTIGFKVDSLQVSKPNLEALLNGQISEIIVEEKREITPSQVEGMCIECGDQPAVVYCEQCADGMDYDFSTKIFAKFAFHISIVQGLERSIPSKN
jgi:hypothetical protein